MTQEVWDYIFLGTEVSASCKVPQEKLALMRNEFMWVVCLPGLLRSLVVSEGSPAGGFRLGFPHGKLIFS